MVGREHDPNVPRCGVTNKVMFDSRDAAWAALTKYARARGSTRPTKRCPFCEHYHLTKGVRGMPGK
jgi:hypothetical protein